MVLTQLAKFLSESNCHECEPSFFTKMGEMILNWVHRPSGPTVSWTSARLLMLLGPNSNRGSWGHFRLSGINVSFENMFKVLNMCGFPFSSAWSSTYMAVGPFRAGLGKPLQVILVMVLQASSPLRHNHLSVTALWVWKLSQVQKLSNESWIFIGATTLILLFFCPCLFLIIDVKWRSHCLHFYFALRDARFC